MKDQKAVDNLVLKAKIDKLSNEIKENKKEIQKAKEKLKGSV